MLPALIVSAAFADPNLQPNTEPKEKSAFEQAIQHNSNVRTEERWVQVGNTKYREVTIHGEKYYLHFTGRNEEFAELDCKIPSGNNNPHMVEGAVQVYHRTKMFADFLQETCATDANGQVRPSVRLDPRLGFTIPDGKNPVLTNKKVFVKPKGVGFSGDF